MPIYTVVDDADDPGPIQHPAITLVDPDGGPYNPATAIPSGTYAQAVEEVHLYATGGAGTSVSPWTSPTGSGGLAEALTASATSGKPVHAKAGYYAITATVTNWFTGANVLTEGSRTIFKPSGLSDGRMFTIAGTAGAYLERVIVGGFHIDRALSGTVRTDYVRRSQFGRITCNGNGADGGGVLSIHHTDRSQFLGVIAWGMGTLGSAVFADFMEDCQFGQIIQDTGQEAVDLSTVRRCQFSQIIAIDSADEGVDVGNTSYSQFSEIIVNNSTNSGVHVKIEDGGPWGGSFRNQFDSIIVIEQGLAGMYVNNGPGTPNGTDICSHNTVGKLTIVSTKVGAIGFSSSANATNPTNTGNALHNVSISVPGIGIYAARSIDFRVEGGYVESTNAVAVRLDTVSTRPSVRNLKVISGGSPGSPSTVGAFTISTAVTDAKVEFNEVISSTTCGMVFAEMTGSSVSYNMITEVSGDGIKYDVSATAGFTGAVHNSFKHNRIRNVGRTIASRYHFRMTQTGGTTATAVHIDGNDCWDVTAGASGPIFWSGTWDYCSFQDNDVKGIAGGIGGSMGANSVIRNNVGMRTENNGTATVTSGNTSINVTHGLWITPALDDISVTPTNNLGAATKFWISTPTSTLFTINVDAAPGAPTATFAWSASMQ